MCGPSTSAATGIFMIVSYNNPATVYKSDPAIGGHIRCCVIREIGIYVSCVIVDVYFLYLLHNARLIWDPCLYDRQCPTGQFACDLDYYRLRVLGQVFPVIGLHDQVGTDGLP